MSSVSSGKSDPGFGRIGSIRKASAALKNKLVKRTRSWGSADCIAEEDYATVISDRKAHSTSPTKDVFDRLLMPPPKDFVVTNVNKGKTKKQGK